MQRTTSEPIQIDLRRDLPKALAMREHLIKSVGHCSYSEPCVVGAMMSEEDRVRLVRLGRDGTRISGLFRDQIVVAPSDQQYELSALQAFFDRKDDLGLSDYLDELAAKYLPEQVRA